MVRSEEAVWMLWASWTPQWRRHTYCDTIPTCPGTSSSHGSPPDPWCWHLGALPAPPQLCRAQAPPSNPLSQPFLPCSFPTTCLATQEIKMIKTPELSFYSMLIRNLSTAVCGSLQPRTFLFCCQWKNEINFATYLMTRRRRSLNRTTK